MNSISQPLSSGAPPKLNMTSYYFADAHKIEIAVVSDIHASMVSVSALAEYLVERNILVDLIICCGDIADMQGDDFTNEVKFHACEGDLSTLLSTLENIQCRVAWVPGNHDPKTATEQDKDFADSEGAGAGAGAGPSVISGREDGKHRFTAHSFNCHDRCLRLSHDLVIVGFGGSIPAVQGDKVVWEGYPFSDDKPMLQSLSRRLAAVPNEPPPPTPASIPGLLPPTPLAPRNVVMENDAVLVLTHIGPGDSTTTIDKRYCSRNEETSDAAKSIGVGPIITGSDGFRELLQNDEQQRRVLCNLHGHVHSQCGRDDVGKIPIINPGSLRDGNFAVLRLEREQKSNSWHISSTEFMTAPKLS